MTLLTKIRNRSGLLVTIIAVALLIFILESALESRKGLSASDRSKIAIINDKDVSIEEFQSKLDMAENNQKAQSQKSTLDENTRENLRAQVWNQLLVDYVVKPRYEKIGIAVSEDELFDMVQGKDPHPQIKQAFTDQKTNEFSPLNVINFLKNMDKDETGETKNRWIVFEQAIKDERVSQKYTAMIKKGLYVTKAEAQRNFLGTGRTANIVYVAKKYSDIPDITITVSEDDLKKYYNENKSKYKQRETVRGIDYIEFNVVPSNDDRRSLAENLDKLKAEFAVAEVDSDFVNQNADTRYTDKLIGANAGFVYFDSLSRSPLGTVVGPYPEGNSFKIAKLSGIKMLPDSVKARHILISIVNGDSKKAKERADSLKTAIKGGKKFEDLAKVFSKDPGSGAKGGDLGWFKEGMMVKPFNDACFEGKKGDLQIVESQFGFHIIQLIKRRGEMINVRHILISPKFSSTDIKKAQLELDSIRNQIVLGTISFEEAALKFSKDEETKLNGGLLINPATGTTKFDVAEIEPGLFFILDKLKLGEVSDVTKQAGSDNKPAFKLLKIKSKSEPHRANLKDDYQRLQNIALQQKQAKVVNTWINKKRKQSYIKITEEYMGCQFRNTWFDKEKQQ